MSGLYSLRGSGELAASKVNQWQDSREIIS
jgi:hypothetical protein